MTRNPRVFEGGFEGYTLLHLNEIILWNAQDGQKDLRSEVRRQCQQRPNRSSIDSHNPGAKRANSTNSCRSCQRC